MNAIEAGIGWLATADNWAGPNGIGTRLVEHVEISVLSMLIACAIALPVGLYIGHTRRGVGLAVNLANVGRAVPSLALIGLVVPFTQAFDPAAGFSFYPVLAGMVVLAIPPILVNAYTGISEVDREIVEAARGMGYRENQTLARVELPLAWPVILGGLRSAAVQVIATATLGAIFGGGGLGRFIIDGIAQNDDGQLWGGVLLVAVLAVSSETAFASIQWLGRRGRAAPKPKASRLMVELGQGGVLGS